MRVGGAMLPFAKENMKALTYDIFIDYPISSLRGSLWYDHAISLNVQSLKPIILAQHQSLYQNFAPIKLLPLLGNAKNSVLMSSTKLKNWLRPLPR